MSRDRDDDYDDEEGRPTDVGSALRDRVKTENGKLKIFGKEFDVGPQAAVLLSPVVTSFINWVSLRGSSWITNAGTNLSSFVLPNHAAKIGGALGQVWLYGLPMAGVAMGVKKTISNGYAQMNALRDQAQPLLAANHKMDVSMSKALTSKFGVLADARARIWATGKRDFCGNIVGTIRALPTILTGRFQTQLDKKISEEGRIDTIVTSATEGTRVPGQENNILMNMFRFMSDPTFSDRLKKVSRGEGSQQEHRQVLSDLNSLPLLADLAAGFLERRVVKGEGKEIAWDRIMELQDYVERHKRNAEPSRVAVLVKDIFQQRAKDLKKHYELEGTGFESVTNAIAGAIVSGMHPQALAEILDNRKIVSFDARDADFGDNESVQEQLENLKEKYSKRISEKQFYKNAAFTKESLLETFKGVPEEEKPFFVMLFPPGILEKAGVSKQDVRKYRNESKDYFTGELTQIITQMAQAGREELKEQGVRDKLIDRLDAFKDKMAQGSMEKNLAEATEVVRDIAASAKNQQAFWQAYLKKRGAEEVETPRRPETQRTPVDYAARGEGDEFGMDM